MGRKFKVLTKDGKPINKNGKFYIKQIEAPSNVSFLDYNKWEIKLVDKIIIDYKSPEEDGVMDYLIEIKIKPVYLAKPTTNLQYFQLPKYIEETKVFFLPFWKEVVGEDNSIKLETILKKFDINGTPTEFPTIGTDEEFIELKTKLNSLQIKERNLFTDYFLDKTLEQQFVVISTKIIEKSTGNIISKEVGGSTKIDKLPNNYVSIIWSSIFVNFEDEAEGRFLFDKKTTDKFLWLGSVFKSGAFGSLRPREWEDLQPSLSLSPATKTYTIENEEIKFTTPRINSKILGEKIDEFGLNVINYNNSIFRQLKIEQPTLLDSDETFLQNPILNVVDKKGLFVYEFKTPETKGNNLFWKMSIESNKDPLYSLNETMDDYIPSWKTDDKGKLSITTTKIEADAFHNVGLFRYSELEINSQLVSDSDPEPTIKSYAFRGIKGISKLTINISKSSELELGNGWIFPKTTPEIKGTILNVMSSLSGDELRDSLFEIPLFKYEQVGVSKRILGLDDSEKLKNIRIPLILGDSYSIKIGRGAFYRNQLTSLVLEESVTEIEPDAFSENNLTSVNIPKSVSTIGSFAFKKNLLTSVTFGNYSRLEYIGNLAFADNKITSVTIPRSVKTIEGGAFQGNKLTSVTIPSGVELIGYAVFESNELTSVTIENGITSIEGAVFRDNKLTSVTIPNSVEVIEIYAFEKNLLTSVTIGNGVKEIKGGAFENNNLTSLTIPNNVEIIKDNAFANNPLTEVFIPTTTIVAPDAFDPGVTITRY